VSGVYDLWMACGLHVDKRPSDRQVRRSRRCSTHGLCRKRLDRPLLEEEEEERGAGGSPINPSQLRQVPGIPPFAMRLGQDRAPLYYAR